jgi:hypothetical protein
VATGTVGGIAVVAGLGQRSRVAFVVVTAACVAVAVGLVRTAAGPTTGLTILLSVVLVSSTLAPSTRRWFFSDEGA